MMLPVPERVKVAMAMIERAANNEATCPTNLELACAVGGSSMSTGAGIVAALETMGMIKVQRGIASRVVTIVATGRRTAGNIGKTISRVRRPSKALWNTARDNVLMEAISQDLDFEQAAHWVGIDAEQCAARFDELAARLGAQAA